MKHANAAASKPPGLVQKRALIRDLIEQNGWASTPAQPLLPTSVTLSPTVDNIIPFPVASVRR